MAYNIDFRQATSDAPACLTEYLNYLTTIKNRSQLTALNYYTDLRMFMRFLKVKNKLVDANEDFSEIKISDLDDKYIKAVTLTDAMEFLSFTVSERSNQAKARSRKAVSLRQFYKFLTNNKAWFAASPMLNLELPSPKNALPKHLTLQECGQLLHEGFKEFSSWMDYRDYAMIIMFLNCGMRLSELVGINVNDFVENIDPSQPCVKYLSVKVLGKGNKERIVYFNARAKIHLQQYLTSRKDRNKALFVSLAKPHKRLEISGVETRLRKIGRLAKIVRVHPHKFRRTLATMAIDKGMPVEQVQRLLGHVKIDTTMHYAMVNQNNVKLSHRKFIN